MGDQMETATSLTVMTDARRGDALAMEQLLRRTYPIAAYHCEKYLADSALARQTTREALVILGSKLNHLETPAAYTGWVNRTCARLCVNALGRTGTEFQFVTQWDPMPEEPDDQLVPDPMLDNALIAAEVEKAADALELTQRLCLYLYYFDRLSFHEMAQLLGTSEQNIACTLKEARLRLGKIPVVMVQQRYTLSPLPYLHYFLTRRMEERDDPVAARTVVRSILAGEPEAPAALPENEPFPEVDLFPETDPFPELAPCPEPEEEKPFPFWLLFAAILSAVALGFGAAVYANGASFSELVQKILNEVF